MHINISKIVIHEGVSGDTVFLFTSVKLSEIDFLNLIFEFPVGEGAKWIEQEFNTTTYDVVKQGMEVCAP